MDGNLIIQTLEYVEKKWNDYLSPIVFVREYEGGVMLRMGKFKKYLKPGINFKWPYPFREAHKTLIKSQTLSVEVSVTTSDNKTITLEVIIEYEITDVKLWLLEANDAETNLTDLLKGFSTDVLVDESYEEINKKTIKTKIKNKLNEQIGYLGVKVNKVLFGKNVLTRNITISGIQFPRKDSSNAI